MKKVFKSCIILRQDKREQGDEANQPPPSLFLCGSDKNILVHILFSYTYQALKGTR
jgi:hypothetical protein